MTKHTRGEETAHKFVQSARKINPGRQSHALAGSALYTEPHCNGFIPNAVTADRNRRCLLGTEVDYGYTVLRINTQQAYHFDEDWARRSLG